MASPRVPFTSDRLIAVRFQRTFPVQALSTDVFEAGRLRQRLAAPGSVPVTSVLFVDLRFDAIHYMRGASGALWPALIEKAYAVGRGANTYQGLEDTVGLAEAMRDMTGSAEEEHLVKAPGDTLPPITNKKLNAWLAEHATRPIILGSPDNAPLVTGNHTFAVIGKTKTTLTVIDALKANAGNARGHGADGPDPRQLSRDRARPGLTASPGLARSAEGFFTEVITLWWDRSRRIVKPLSLAAASGRRTSGRAASKSRCTSRPVSMRECWDWVSSIGLEPSAYGTHSMRRSKAAQIYRKTRSLRAVQLLLGHTKRARPRAAPRSRRP